jgi:hypothetical protein
MTIAAAYLVSEGVVFGADSSTMVSVKPPGTPGAGVVQLLDHSQKVFEVGQNSRLGVCTWGAGALGDVSHRTVIAQLADEITDESTVEEAARKLGDLAKPLAEKHGIDFVGYFLGGWETKTRYPACFKVEVGKDKLDISPLQMGLCSFSGMPHFFVRVFRGFDPDLPKNLCEEIKALLPESPIKDNFDEAFEQAFKKASDPLIAAGHKDLPIREAIDFVYSYLHITVKATKFRFGAPGCGGPIEVGFVTTDRPFRWASHKTFVSAIVEQEGEF